MQLTNSIINTQSPSKNSDILIDGKQRMIPNLRDRELGKRSDVRSQLVLAQRYAVRVMAALRASLAKLMQRAAQGSVVAQYMVYLNLRAQERWFDRSRPFY